MENQLKETISQIKNNQLAEMKFTKEMQLSVLNKIKSHEHTRKIPHRILPVFLTILLVSILFIFFFNIVGLLNGQDANSPKNSNNLQQIVPHQETGQPSLHDFETILLHLKEIESNTFKNTNGYKFRNLTTKKQFYQVFNGLAARQFLEKAYSKRLEERSDGLYVVPMENPFYFDNSEPSKLKKITSDEYVLTQQTHTDMYGNVTLTVFFKKTNNQWIIVNVNPLR